MTLDMKDMTPEQIAQYNEQQDPLLRAMLAQVLICFVKRAGGKVRMPAAEIDNTGGNILTMEVVEAQNGPVFEFKVGRKQ